MAGLGGGEAGDLLQLVEMAALDLLELGGLVGEVALAVVEGLLAALELAQLRLDRLHLAQRLLLHADDLLAAGAQLGLGVGAHPVGVSGRRRPGVGRRRRFGRGRRGLRGSGASVGLRGAPQRPAAATAGGGAWPFEDAPLGEGAVNGAAGGSPSSRGRIQGGSHDRISIGCPSPARVPGIRRGGEPFFHHRRGGVQVAWVKGGKKTPHMKSSTRRKFRKQATNHPARRGSKRAQASGAARRIAS